MWEAYTYKEGDRGDYNVDKSLSNSHVDDQLEELRDENKQLKIENETLIKENTELKLQIEKLQKNNKEINK
jgi:regulator of replication initiation timing